CIGKYKLLFRLQPIVSWREEKKLDKNESNQLGLGDFGKDYVVKEGRRQDLALILMSLDENNENYRVSKGILTEISSEKLWNLSCSKDNLLVTNQFLCSLTNPSGYIPDNYLIPTYMEVFGELQKQGKIKNDDKFYHLDSIKDKDFAPQQRIKGDVSISKKRHKEIIENTMQNVVDTNISLRPAGFYMDAKLFKTKLTSDTTWEWNENNKWYNAFVRKELCPLELKIYSDNWIWDANPWIPDKSGEVIRIFKKKIPPFTKTESGKALPLEFKLFTCGDAAFSINGKKVRLYSAEAPENPVRQWIVRDQNELYEAIKYNDANTIELTIINRPKVRTFENRVGLQVSLSNHDKEILTSDKSWQVCKEYYLNWQIKHNQDIWHPVITEADYLCSEIFSKTPVIWGDEPKSWNLLERNNSIRYFKRKFDWQTKTDGFIKIASPDKVNVFLNGLEIESVNREGIKIPARFFKEKENILAVSVENDFIPPISSNKNFAAYIDKDTKQLKLKPSASIQNNPYAANRYKTKRGNIIDRDAFSLPKLRLISGNDSIINLYHEIPLSRSKTHKNDYIKDIIFISAKGTNTELFTLPCYKKSYMKFNFSSDTGTISINYTNPKMPDNNWYEYYSLYKERWNPNAPVQLDDAFVIPRRINITELKNHFEFDRVQIPLRRITRGNEIIFDKNLNYTCFIPKDINASNPEIFQNGSNPQFKTGELIILDKLRQHYHSLEIDDYNQYTSIQENGKYDIPVLRFLAKSGGDAILMKAIGKWEKGAFALNGNPVTKDVELKDKDIITVSGYTFQFCKNEKGLLAGNIDVNGKTERFYPPGLGLSHTVGVYYDFYQNGIEKSLDSVLTGRCQNSSNCEPLDVHLTIDDDLTRIVSDEVNRQLGIIDIKYGYKKWVLNKQLNDPKTNLALRELLKEELSEIESRQRFGMVVILNENAEILSAASEPTPLSTHDAIREALHFSEKHPAQNPLINRCFHDARFRPGSSFKLVTAMAGFESKDPAILNFMEKTGWTYQNAKSLDDIETLPNGPLCVKGLKNHEDSTDTTFHGEVFKTALQHSHNIWFSYLGLLLNKTTLKGTFGCDMNKGYISPKERADDFLLLAQAEKLGFNQPFILYNLKPKIIELFMEPNFQSIDDPLTIESSHFPSEIFDQRIIARTAIGQHNVTETTVLNALISLSLSSKYNGFRPYPVLIHSIKHQNGKTAAETQHKMPTEVCTATTAQKIRDAMKTVVLDGTGKSVFMPSPLRDSVYGKTGSSETGKAGLYTNSWWTCFVETPDGKTYAIAACFPDAGLGASHAADCVKRIVDKMYRYYGWDETYNK
ncbi:MAG: hypothetical protein HQK78_10755, partial [Desulfobacterales bacterium]|nr:hypothetical protein [Desulfobacterales bacterium]